MNAKDLPPTDLLYNDDPYAAECEASVIAASGDDLVLDRTVFYPEGGGQAADSGTLNGIPVHRLERVTISERSTPEGIPIPLDSTVVHTVPDHGLVAGDRAHLVLDWERRYANMKMHTAAHLLFAATREFLEEEGQSAVTKGCQIEGASARFDFRADIGTEAIAGIERRVRELAQSGLEAHVESADNGLRTWHLGEIEIPCGGTHVRSMTELDGEPHVKRRRKGAGLTRLYIALT